MPVACVYYLQSAWFVPEGLILASPSSDTAFAPFVHSPELGCRRSRLVSCYCRSCYSFLGNNSLRLHRTLSGKLSSQIFSHRLETLWVSLTKHPQSQVSFPSLPLDTIT